MDTAPIIVVGASAGGVEALQALAAGLPPAFPAAVCVVLHVHAHVPSSLPAILSRAGPLPALHPQDGEVIQPGRIYVAPPDCHLLVEGDTLGVKKGPKESRFRPAVDALFRSAAYTRTSQVIGVVLSGVLDDGTSGLWTIKRLGGVAIVQDPLEAAFDGMPRHALEHVEVDHQVQAPELGALLTQLVRDFTLRGTEADMNDDDKARLEKEVLIAAAEPDSLGLVNALGPYTPFTCPECHGALVEIKEGPLLRFRCHTGHGYTPDALLVELSETIEEKLYQTQRALEESLMLLDHLGRRVTGAQLEALLSQARTVEQRATVLYRRVLEHTSLGDEEPSPS